MRGRLVVGGVLVVAMVGLITGSIIRFNIVKLSGRDYAEAGRGYVQLFGGDLELLDGDGSVASRLGGHLYGADHDAKRRLRPLRVRRRRDEARRYVPRLQYD